MTVRLAKTRGDAPKPHERRSGKDVEAEIVKRALSKAIGTRMARALLRKDALAVVITIPSEVWIEPVETACQGVREWREVIIRMSAQRKSWDTEKDETVAYSLCSGSSVLGISDNPKRCLPKTLLHGADFAIRLEPPAGPDLAAIVEFVTGHNPGPIDDIRGLDLSAIIASCRPTRSAKRCVARLRRAAAAEAATEDVAGVPPLEKLAGYGAAGDWALQIQRDFEAFRAGDLSFDALESRIVLSSAPGLGKTQLARAVAASLKIPFISSSIGRLFSRSTGDLGAVIRSLDEVFASARRRAPAVLLLDELDALPSRSRLSARNQDFWTTVITHALTTLDDLKLSGEPLILVGATNYQDRLDPALIRPGRFDRVITIHPPDAAAREKILWTHIGDDLPETADLSLCGKFSEEMSGAELVAVVADAKRAARLAGRKLTVADIIAVLCKGDTRSPAELWRTAVHESGHAVGAYHLVDRSSIESVSILDAKSSFGQTIFKRQQDFAMMTKGQLEALIIVGLCGRAAETAILGECVAGSINDLRQASELLLMMHRAGFSGSLAPQLQDEDRRGLQADLCRQLSDQMADLFDRACRFVVEHQQAIERVAAALLKRSHLSGDDVTTLISQDGRHG